jgi:peptidoglycan/xylan/chitin deacetylase (PgdA/CDA1 family)
MRRWTLGVVLALVVILVLAVGGYYLANSRSFQLAVDSAENASADQTVAETVDAVRPGSIILLHVMYEGRTASRAAIPRIVAELRADGYRFVTVSDLISR